MFAYCILTTWYLVMWMYAWLLYEEKVIIFERWKGWVCRKLSQASIPNLYPNHNPPKLISRMSDFKCFTIITMQNILFQNSIHQLHRSDVRLIGTAKQYNPHHKGYFRTLDSSEFPFVPSWVIRHWTANHSLKYRNNVALRVTGKRQRTLFIDRFIAKT